MHYITHKRNKRNVDKGVWMRDAWMWIETFVGYIVMCFRFKMS